MRASRECTLPLLSAKDTYTLNPKPMTLNIPYNVIGEGCSKPHHIEAKFSESTQRQPTHNWEERKVYQESWKNDINLSPKIQVVQVAFPTI